MEHLDAIVIGMGPGGEVVADRLEFVETKRARDVEIAPEPPSPPPAASQTEYTDLPGDEDFPF